MKNVLIITGSRAEYGLLESTIKEMKKSKKLKPIVMVTGMHTLLKYGYTMDLIDYDARVYITEEGTMLQWLSQMIKGIEMFCLSTKIDCIVVLGDRDEPLAGAIVGSHLGIPVAHIHGGDVSGNENVDNKSRHAITQLSEFHFTVTKKSYERVVKMKGKENVFMVGGPGIDTLLTTPIKKVKKHKALIVLHPSPLDKVSIKTQIDQVYQAVKDLDYIWVYPNSDTGSDTFLKYLPKDAIENLERLDYINYMRTVDMLIGNSSSGIIEAMYFNLPVINIGNRQKGRETTDNVVNVPYNTAKIKYAIKHIKRHKVKPIYGNGTAGIKIIKHLEHLL